MPPHIVGILWIPFIPLWQGGGACHGVAICASPHQEETRIRSLLSQRELAVHMARFPEAERRRLLKMICAKRLLSLGGE
jgi:hypothetical protein